MTDLYLDVALVYVLTCTIITALRYGYEPRRHK